MEADDLSTFRERWKHELKTEKSSKDKGGYFGHHSKDSPSDQKTSYWQKQTQPRHQDQPQYVSIAEGLLDGRTSPLLERIKEERTRRKRAPESDAINKGAPPKKVSGSCHKLLEQFIQDLVSGWSWWTGILVFSHGCLNKCPSVVLKCVQNEVNDIPFFDVELPYELALKIFQFLSRTDLSRCAQVNI